MRKRTEPKKQWFVTMPISLVEEVNRIAEEEDRTITSVAERLLRAGLEQYRQGVAPATIRWMG